MALLERLDGVKQTGQSAWTAKCPHHDDRISSLVVKELGDGRWLLHCFAGCDVYDVLGSLGLCMSDLFPAGPIGPEQQAWRVQRPFSAFDALRALSFESAVVAIAAADIVDGKPLNEADAQRVAQAAGRIAEALEVVHGRMD